MFGMNSKVWIISSQKIDGRYNKGKIVGIEKEYFGLGFFTERQYLNDFEESRYKVAYVDVVTERASAEWFHYSELSKEKPDTPPEGE